MPKTPAKQLAVNKAWRIAHRAEIKAQKAAKVAADPEGTSAKRAAWYAANQGHIRAQRKANRLANLAEEQAKAAAWRAANPEKVKATQRKADEKRKETHSVAMRIQYANRDIEADRQRRRDWAAENPDKVRAHHKRRKAFIRGAAISDLTAAQWRRIKDYFDNRCVYCPADCQDCIDHTHELTQDHLIPLSQGGNHTVSNVVPACLRCNCSKHDGPPPVSVEPMTL